MNMIINKNIGSIRRELEKNRLKHLQNYILVTILNSPCVAFMRICTVCFMR